MTRPPLRVLLAEDEENLGAILESFLHGRGHAVRRVSDGRAALDELRRCAYDVALLDVRMPEIDGLEVLRALSLLADPPEAVVVTGNGTADVALTALQLGAYDYLTKPYRMAEVDFVVRRAAEKRGLRREVAALRQRLADGDGFATAHAALSEAVSAAAVAPPGMPIVLVGERGTERCTIARTLHAAGSREGDVLRELACIGNAARDAERLFGGADCVATADGVLSAPTALLVHDADRLAPLVADACRRWLDACAESASDGGAASGDPRAYFTLRASNAQAAADWPGCIVHVPPLRERPMDVPLLAERLLGAAARRSGGVAPVLEPDAVAWLATRPWPGNVAELRLVLELAALRGGDLLTVDAVRDVATTR